MIPITCAADGTYEHIVKESLKNHRVQHCINCVCLGGWSVSYAIYLQYRPVVNCCQPIACVSYCASLVCVSYCVSCACVSNACVSYVCVSYVSVSYVCVSYVSVSYVCVSYVCVSYVVYPVLVYPMFVCHIVYHTICIYGLCILSHHIVYPIIPCFASYDWTPILITTIIKYN